MKTMRERLDPVGERRVDEVVRARPHVREDQRPEGDDGEPVAEDGQPGRLREEVVEHREDRGREDEARPRCARTTTGRSRSSRRRTGGSSCRGPPAPRGCSRGTGPRRRRRSRGRTRATRTSAPRRRLMTVPKTFTANITQSTTMAMSSGHSSSAYSSDWVCPARSETAASAMPALKSQSCDAREPREQERPLAEPHHDPVAQAEDRADAEPEGEAVRVHRPQPAEGEVRREVRGRRPHLDRDEQADEDADDAPEDRRQDEPLHGPVVVAVVGHAMVPSWVDPAQASMRSGGRNTDPAHAPVRGPTPRRDSTFDA